MKSQSFTPNLPVTNGDLTQTRLSAIENKIPCEAIIDYEIDNNIVGAYLTKEGSNTSENYRLVFGFETIGFHSNLRESEVLRVFENITNTLKQLPMGELVTVKFSSYSDDRQRQFQLSTLLAIATHPLIALMLIGQKKRVSQLTIAHKRKPQSIKVFVTFTARYQENKGYDFTQLTLSFLQSHFERLWRKFARTDEIVEREKMDGLLTRGYEGFTRWQQLLSISLGLPITPMKSQNLYEELWYTFNSEDCPNLPQRVVFDGKTAVEEIDSEIHFVSHLFKNQSMIPVPDRAWVFVKNQFVAPLMFWDKPGGFASEREELNYLLEIFNRDAVYDTDCVVQFSRADNEQTKKEMVKIMKHARSDREGDGDEVVTSEIEKAAIDAQQSLYRGDVPIRTAVVFLVRRDTLEKLETDCNYLKQCFPLPAEIQRDLTSAYQTFLDTMPISWNPLLTYKSSLGQLDLRLSYKTDEAPAFSSLMTPQLFDKDGLEFVTDEGRIPVHLDLFRPNSHKNIGLFATTRAGKSVLVAGINTIAIASEIPVIIIDSPPSEAASTFKDYVQQLGGQYFDIRKESSNLLEPPDLSAFQGDSDDDQEELRIRNLEFTSFVQKAIMIIVLGDAIESDEPNAIKFTNDVESLVFPTLDKFFNDQGIKDLYANATDSGFGSDAWKKMPTLKHYVSYFAENWKTDLSEVELNDPSNTEAAAYILKRLRTVLQSPLGVSIGRPSTIQSDSHLLCYALIGLENSPRDIYILSLAAQAAVLRRTLKSKMSIVFFDEVSVQLEYPAIGNLIAKLCANGAKAGIRVILAMQDPNTLAASKSAAKILQNLSLILIGRITESAIPSFQQVFRLDETVISKNASDKFFPDPTDFSSHWLAMYRGITSYLRYYPSMVELALIANNPHESAPRKAWINAYKHDPIEGFIKFSEVYARSIQTGESIPYPPGELQESVTIPMGRDSPAPANVDTNQLVKV
jgi:hypothetical protein